MKNIIFLLLLISFGQIHAQIKKPAATTAIYKTPNPSIAIKGKELKGVMNRGLFFLAIKLDAFISSDTTGLQDSCKVISFKLRITKGPIVRTYESLDNFFTTYMVTALNKTRSGDLLYFQDILMSMPNGSTKYIENVEVQIK